MNAALAPLIPTPEDAGEQASLEDRLASVQKVLGEGIHPRAVERLIQMWPEAVVAVTHTDGARDGVRSKVTRVVIRYHGNIEYDGRPNANVAVGEARCRLDHDRFDRRTGRTLAFNRALKRVPR